MKRHLENDELAKMGVNNDDYGTHSFRICRLSMIGNDGKVSPAFIQKSARHKCLSSTMGYIRLDMQTALRASDLISRNDPKEGWERKFAGKPRTLTPHLLHDWIKSAPAKVSATATKH